MPRLRASALTLAAALCVALIALMLAVVPAVAAGDSATVDSLTSLSTASSHPLAARFRALGLAAAPQDDSVVGAGDDKDGGTSGGDGGGSGAEEETAPILPPANALHCSPPLFGVPIFGGGSHSRYMRSTYPERATIAQRGVGALLLVVLLVWAAVFARKLAVRKGFVVTGLIQMATGYVFYTFVMMKT